MIGRTDKIIDALEVINNEALILRDKAKIDKEQAKELKNIQKDLYLLKDNVMNKLYRNRILCTVGYYKQILDNSVQRVFVNKIKGNDTEIHSLHCYKNKKYIYKYIGDVGLIEVKDLDIDLSLFQAMEILNEFLARPISRPVNKPKPKVETETKTQAKSESQNKEKTKEKDKTSQAEKPDYKIKETKLVELSRLRVVRDVHIDCYLNPITTQDKKAELKKYMDDNKGKYPKDQAILVHKAKDPKDRRRVIYNIEDGYRRYTLAGELGLDKVYVDIIDE